MVAPLETHASGFLTALSQAPKVFTLHGVPGGLGTRLSETPQPSWSYGAMRTPQPRPTSLGSDKGRCSILGLVCSRAGTQWL
jgi:hypothetical protein